MIPTHIRGTSIADVWFQLLYNLIDKIENKEPGARRYTIDQGSYVGQDRLEYDLVIAEITQPWIRPLLPEFPPQLNLPPIANYENDPQEAIDSYMSYLISPEKAPDEHYTYGERISLSWKKVVEIYQESGWNTNVPIFQVGQPSDILMVGQEKNECESSTPCLRLIQPRISDGKLHFVVYFRSWDLWGGFPVNLGGIQVLKEALVEEIGNGLQDGSLIGISPGLHIYDHVEVVAYARLGKEKKS
jgi:thymidylate synthase